MDWRPPGRVVRQNATGHDLHLHLHLHLHLTNYQDRYYGGSGMIRLYHFDLARNTIDVVQRARDCRQTVAAGREPLRQRDRAGIRRPPRRAPDRHPRAEPVTVPERLASAANCRELGRLLVGGDKLLPVSARNRVSQPTRRGARGVSG